MARILLTEDDEAVRTFVKRALELDGHAVQAVEDGGEAAEALDHEEGHFDLLLSDIMMPVMDGIALAMQTSENFPGLPILLMTGFADQRERTSEVEEVVHDVISKPFSLADIRRAVRHALSGVQQDDHRLYA